MIRIRYRYTIYEHSERATFFSWLASIFFTINVFPFLGILAFPLMLCSSVFSPISGEDLEIAFLVFLASIGYFALFIKVIFPGIEKLAVRDQEKATGKKVVTSFKDLLPNGKTIEPDDVVKSMNEKLKRSNHR